MNHSSCSTIEPITCHPKAHLRERSSQTSHLLLGEAVSLKGINNALLIMISCLGHTVEGSASRQNADDTQNCRNANP